MFALNLHLKISKPCFHVGRIRGLLESRGDDIKPKHLSLDTRVSQSDTL